MFAAGSSPLHKLDGELRVEVLTSLDALLVRAADWDELSRSAVQPNAFYERSVLAPAVRSFGADVCWRFITVWRGSRRRDVLPGLVGLFPCEWLPGRFGCGARLRLWGCDYTFLRTPLVRAGHAAAVAHALLDWANTSGAALLEFPCLSAEGDFARELTDVLHARQTHVFAAETWARAMLHRGSTAEAVLARMVSGHHRRELERQRRRLGDLGPVELRTASAADLDEWISRFLELEAQGWKGQSGTALSQSAASREYFTTIVHEAAAQDRLQFLGLTVAGRPVALKVNLLAPPGSFAFKIAYDESLARNSPGVQLELENIRQLHERPDLLWMDSCAAPHHPMINRLWPDRTLLQHLVIATDRWSGHCLLGLRGAARAARRLWVAGQRPRRPGPAQDAAAPAPGSQATAGGPGGPSPVESTASSENSSDAARGLESSASPRSAAPTTTTPGA
jgi:hypothetical protein